MNDEQAGYYPCREIEKKNRKQILWVKGGCVVLEILAPIAYLVMKENGGVGWFGMVDHITQRVLPMSLSICCCCRDAACLVCCLFCDLRISGKAHGCCRLSVLCFSCRSIVHYAAVTPVDLDLREVLKNLLARGCFSEEYDSTCVSITRPACVIGSKISNSPWRTAFGSSRQSQRTPGSAAE